MSFFDELSARLPFTKKDVELEYYFALNIGSEKLTAALWTIEGKELKILDTASDHYSSQAEIASVADKLLDAVLGIREIEPQKILFGVPSHWLSDDNLKDEYLRILRSLVKDLELTPMAYVAVANALVNFLEKLEGVPTTAILAGFEENHITTTVVRAGKLDGVKIVQKGENSGVNLEKALLTFASVETLPSKILIYDSNSNLEKLKSQLLSYNWMSKLSFLHFPKIDILGSGIEIKSVCLAGASELNSDVTYTDKPLEKQAEKSVIIDEEETETEEEEEEEEEVGGNFGFMVGDVSKQPEEEVKEEESNLLEVEDFENEVAPMETSLEPPPEEKSKRKLNFKKFIPKKLVKSPILLGIVAIILVILTGLIFIPTAYVKIFVEPKILEKDAQVIADPNQKTVDENAKIIPGQIVDTQVSGSGKDSATGSREIGNPAKGAVVIYNGTDSSKTIASGIVMTISNGLKFTLDKSVNVASRSASPNDPLSTVSGKSDAVAATAVAVGPESNISSGTSLTVGSFAKSDVIAKSEGNFSGGTSQTIKVVSSDDQKRLLAKVSSDLRLQAQQKLQEKLAGKKILQEALTEEILSKSYNKNINDQASEFSLNLSAKYKGTAYNDSDLRLIVSKLVTTQVPDGFTLDLSATETQADVSNVERSGKVVFLAKFKAKLIPKLDIQKIKDQIKGRSVSEVQNMIKAMDNVLGSDIKISPKLPSFLQRLPIFTKNITVEVGLK